MTQKQQIKLLVDYEVRSSAWICLCIFQWMQKLAGDYYIWKVQRKLRKRRWFMSAKAKVLKRTYYRIHR